MYVPHPVKAGQVLCEDVESVVKSMDGESVEDRYHCKSEAGQDFVMDSVA